MMRNLLAGIKKEILLVIRHKNAMLLVILFPLITIGAFGGLYSYTLNQTLSIAVFEDQATKAAQLEAPKNDFQYQINFVDELRKNKNINAIEVNSEEEAKQKVLQNDVDSALIIKRPDQKAPYEITVLVDTTDFVQSSVVWGTLSNQINTITNNISVTVIQKIYEKIVSQEYKTKQQLENIDTFLVEFEKTKQMTNELYGNLDYYDANLLRQSIIDQNTQLVALRNQLYNSRVGLYTQKSTLSYFKTSYTYMLNQYGLKGTDANGNSTAPQGIAETSELVSSQISSLNESTDFQITTYDSAIAKLDAAIEEMDKLDQYFTQYKKFLADAKKLQVNIERDVKESRAVLVELNETIQGIKQYTPQFLAKPTNLSYGEAIHLPNLASQFFPMVLALVSMFSALLLTAVSIISEKKQNVSSRLKSMPVHKSVLVLQKLVGISIILIAVLSILLFLGTTFFGIQVPGDPLHILFSLALTIFCFVSLGIVIGSLTNNESSAILAILVIVFPMIFLSGLLLPLELMPQGFQIFKIINPLATSATLMINTAIKGIPIIYSIKEIINLAAISFFSLIVGYLKYL